MTLLKKQSEMIRIASQQINAACKNLTSVNTSSTSPEVINTITAKTIQAYKRTVDLSPAITNLQNDILQDANRSVDIDDGDSRDNEDLVIDMKEDEVFESRNNESVSENDKCKYMKYIYYYCQIYHVKPDVSYCIKLHTQLQKRMSQKSR